ncbi:hypothetical protein ACFQPF_15680 [Fictibacillus iocasae]|uniref:SH3b domain-containing protein n=1 Tax=Fictibacillus iocasae TaxID=2715437 RepID=A0ABW2NUQ9_9BACL
MKKFLLIIILLLSLFPYISEKVSATSLVFKFDNEVVSDPDLQPFLLEGKPYDSGGTYYLPLDWIATQYKERLVKMWESKVLYVQRKNYSTMHIREENIYGSSYTKGKNRGIPLKTKTVNGVVTDMKMKAIVKDNHMFVPIDFISDPLGANYPVTVVEGEDTTTIYVGKLPSGVKPVKLIYDDARSYINQKVYSTQSEKSKRIGSFKEHQNIFIIASQNGWYQVRIGSKRGWIQSKYAAIGKFDGTEGKWYPDGWVAPVLKSAWSPNHQSNLKTLERELGFKAGGHDYSIQGAPNSIAIHDGSGQSEVMFAYRMWDGDANGYLKQAYRIPIVSMELFKLYFGKDAVKVWNYFNTDVPRKFTANGRLVTASFSEKSGSLYLEVGYKQKK